MIFKLLTRDGTLGIAQHTNYNMIRFARALLSYFKFR
jgi:hypothetical protein